MKKFMLLLIACFVLHGGAIAQNSRVTRINSVPSGADIYIDSRFVGRTPYEYVSGDEDTIVVSLFYPTISAWNAQVVTDTLIAGAGVSAVFNPSSKTEPDALSANEYEIPRVQMLSEPKNGATLWYAAGAGTAMLVSGGLAAYWKHEADRAYETYVQTRNRSYYDKTYSLDKRSTAALIITQISFGTLVYLLLNE